MYFKYFEIKQMLIKLCILVCICVNILQENKGRVPKILDVELMDNLVNICMPGDDITLTGIIKVILKNNYIKMLIVLRPKNLLFFCII